MWQRIAMVLVAWMLSAVGLRAQSAPRVVLLELFTSEGCSSCPPADALLRQLNGTRTSTGDLVVGISEHVTYWNQLGWRDPFSGEFATERQQAYGARFQQPDVYTPQMVVNGEAQVLGSDRGAVTRAMEKSRHGGTIHVESAKIEGARLAVTFSWSAEAKGAAVADIYAVIAEDSVTSSIARGENAGRTISHTSVATSFVKVATMGAVTGKVIRIPLPKQPAGAANGKRHLILFAQTPGLGPVLAADAVPL